MKLNIHNISVVVCSKL